MYNVRPWNPSFHRLLQLTETECIPSQATEWTIGSSLAACPDTTLRGPERACARETVDGLVPCPTVRPFGVRWMVWAVGQWTLNCSSLCSPSMTVHRLLSTRSPYFPLRITIGPAWAAVLPSAVPLGMDWLERRGSLAPKTLAGRSTFPSVNVSERVGGSNSMDSAN